MQNYLDAFKIKYYFIHHMMKISMILSTFTDVRYAKNQFVIFVLLSLHLMMICVAIKEVL